VDLDTEIETRAGKSVARIFAEEGEARFRELESQVLMQTLGRNRVVLATGGGVLLREENRGALSGRRVFHLHASPEECLRRVLKSRTKRPLLDVPDPREAVYRIYAERGPIYESVGKRVDTEGLSPGEVANEIADLLGRNCEADR
jgi:shikimate kinase